MYTSAPTPPARRGPPAHPLDNEKDGEDQEDPHRDQNDDAVGAQREACQPSSRRGRQFEPGIVRADHQEAVRREQRMAREHVRQRCPMLELVVAREEQGVPHEVGSEETQAQDEGGEQPLVPARSRAGESPRADPEEQNHPHEEQAQAVRGVSVAGQGVGETLQQQSDTCQCDDDTESRPRRRMTQRRQGGDLGVAGCC